MNVEDTADAMVIALKYHAIDIERIISWADENIKASENPNINIIELSLAKTESEAISSLNKISGEGGNKKNISKIFFGYFYDALVNDRVTYEDISKGLYFLSQDGYEPEEGLSGDMMFFWDGIELADRGYFEKNTKEIKSDMLELLRKNKA